MIALMLMHEFAECVSSYPRPTGSSDVLRAVTRLHPHQLGNSRSRHYSLTMINRMQRGTSERSLRLGGSNSARFSGRILCSPSWNPSFFMIKLVDQPADIEWSI
jgi:hypothetical protein